jgi:hypothetical protein
MIARTSWVAGIVASIAALSGAGCGGASSDAKGPEASPSAAPSDPSKPDAQKPDAAKPDATAGKKTLVEHEHDFMTGCGSKVPNATEYCACSWVQMKALFSLDDMNSGSADDPRFGELKTRVQTNCAGKLPEPVIHTQYVAQCGATDARLLPYCECTWTTFRKSVSAIDLMDPRLLNGPKLDLKKQVVKACAPKMPEDVPRGEFMKECAKSPELEPFCACSWKAVRAVASPAEIEASLIDEADVRDRMQKGCGQLVPKKK